MVHAYHVIITAYGFWLPNDPRGSWSTFVASWELFRFGGATKTESRRSLARRPHDARLREAKTALKYPPVAFDDEQRLSIAAGFCEAVTEHDYRVFACSILAEHTHLVIARSDRLIERVIQHLKSKASARLTRDGRRPLAEYRDRHGRVPTPWAEKAWKCFLDNSADIRRAIRYVEANPEKEGRPRQHWPFVVPFDRNEHV